MRGWKVLGVAGLIAAAGLAAARRRRPKGRAEPHGPGPLPRRPRPSEALGDLASVAGAGTPASNGDRRPRSERR